MNLDDLAAATGLTWRVRRFRRGGWELTAWIDDGRGIAVLTPHRSGCTALVRIDGRTHSAHCALVPSVIADVIAAACR